MEGDREAFSQDQERIGYVRFMMEGFSLEVLTEFCSIVPMVLWRVIREEYRRRGVVVPELVRQVQEMNDIWFRGHSAIAASYVKSREERVEEKLVTRLDRHHGSGPGPQASHREFFKGNRCPGEGASSKEDTPACGNQHLPFPHHPGGTDERPQACGHPDRKNLYGKLGVISRSQAVARAVLEGIIQGCG